MKGCLVAREKEESLEQLVEKARAGDRSSFDWLIERFEEKVMKTALYLTRNFHDAQDVAQEVYLKIFRHLPRAESEGELQSWVYRVTVNAARDLQRRRRIWSPLSRLFAAREASDPVWDREIRDRLIRVFSKLSLNERAAFILKEVQELETAEVAAILNCSEVTVRSYLHDARKKLKRSFSDFKEV